MSENLKRSWAPAPSGIVDMARGAGVEERRVYETAGKRLGYGELNAAVGLLLKPQYRVARYPRASEGRYVAADGTMVCR
jgi:hypothetical protein